MSVDDGKVVDSRTTTKTMTSVEFDIGEKFRLRLAETHSKREQMQSEIQATLEQLQQLIQKLPKKPRDSLTTLDNKIVALERQRTQSSLKLSDEKAILRQIKSLEKAKVQLQDYKEQDLIVRQKKGEISRLRELVRSVMAQIAELETALSKVDLAKRLGCSIAELETHTMDCPVDKLGHLIGKQGVHIQHIERSTGAQIDVDKVGRIIHITGNQPAIQAATLQVEKVTLAVNETVQLSPEAMRYLSLKRSVYDDLAEKHPGVFWDKRNGASNTVTIRGLPEAVALAKADLLQVDRNVVQLSHEIQSKETGTVLGKGGVTVTQIVTDYDVLIEIDETNQHKPVVQIIGASDNAVLALDTIKDILYTNEQVQRTVPTTALVRRKLLANSALLLKQLQNQAQEHCGTHTAIFLNFEKAADKADPKAANASHLLVKAPRCCIEKAHQITKQAIDTYQATIMAITVPTYIVPFVIGKKGSTIHEIQKARPDANVDIEVHKESGTILVMADDAQTQNFVKEEIHKIVSQNQISFMEVEKHMLGNIFGALGKEMRETLTDHIGLYLGTDSSDTKILLRGSIQQIDEAKHVLQDFISCNHTCEFAVLPEDERGLYHGGSNSIVNKMENEHNVKIYFSKENRSVGIRGTKNNVEKTQSELKRVIYGDGDYLVSKLKIPNSVIGVLVGKGADNLTKLEQKHTGIEIFRYREYRLICIRGPKDLVEKCRREVIHKISTAKVTETILINNEEYDLLSQNDKLKQLLNGIPVQETLNESSIRIRGVCFDIKDAKSVIDEYLTGKYQTSIELESSQMKKVQTAMNDPSHLDRIRSSTKTDIEVDFSACDIHISGKRSNVKKAKSFVMAFLDSLLPSEFAKVKIAKPIIRVIGDPVALGEIAAQTGVSLSLDRDSNSIIVQSSNTEAVNEAVKLLEIRKMECAKFHFILSFESSDLWLLSKLIENDDTCIQNVKEKSGCSIDLYKDDLLIVINGKKETHVQKAKSMLDQAIEKARKECIFISFPESSMSVFIGKGGSNINRISSNHKVKIERTRKDASTLKIQGNEQHVESAREEIMRWLSSWMNQTEFVPERDSTSEKRPQQVAMHYLKPMDSAKIPVCMTVEKQSFDNSDTNIVSDSSKPKVSNQSNNAARNLFLLLSTCSTPGGNKFSTEQWDSSTVSSGVVSSTTDEESVGYQTASVYKSMSGHRVRI